MKNTVLETYYKKGWLKYGAKGLSAFERLTAGRIFYQDYLKSHVVSVGVVDWARPSVDGGKRACLAESRLKAKDKFLKAYQKIPLEKRWLVEQIVIENKDVSEMFVRRKEMKRKFCEALDCLIYYYCEERMKNGRK